MTTRDTSNYVTDIFEVLQRAACLDQQSLLEFLNQVLSFIQAFLQRFDELRPQYDIDKLEVYFGWIAAIVQPIFPLLDKVDPQFAEPVVNLVVYAFSKFQLAASGCLLMLNGIYHSQLDV